MTFFRYIKHKIQSVEWGSVLLSLFLVCFWGGPLVFLPVEYAIIWMIFVPLFYLAVFFLWFDYQVWKMEEKQ